MNILLVSHGIPSKNDPQWGCFELDQARALSKLGHKISIMAVDGRYRNYYRKHGIEHTTTDKIDMYCLYLFPLTIIRFPKIRLWFIKRMTLFLFRKVIQQQGLPDVIYVHYFGRMYHMSIVRRKYPKIPFVGIEHLSSINKDSISETMQYMGKVAYNSVDRLLAVSESLKRQMSRHFGKDAEVVYDMLGVEFANATIVKRNRDEKFKFVSVGSLLEIKGFNLLIKAFKNSNLAEKNCSLTIIGDGKERHNLQQLIDDNGLANSVKLIGRKNKQEIINILRDSNAFVLASRGETFGVVYIEAMSQGLPVIATACGGPEEFVDHTNGILIPVDDVEALKNALIEMFEKCNRYDNVFISAECNRRFAPQNIAIKLEKIFMDEIEKKKKQV